jgi:hypothetical protein
LDGFPQRRGAFQAHAEASKSFKKLLSYEKEVNDGFAKSAKATIDSCRLTLLPGRIKKIKDFTVQDLSIRQPTSDSCNSQATQATSTSLWGRSPASSLRSDNRARESRRRLPAL